MRTAILIILVLAVIYFVDFAPLLADLRGGACAVISHLDAHIRGYDRDVATRMNNATMLAKKEQYKSCAYGCHGDTHCANCAAIRAPAPEYYYNPFTYPNSASACYSGPFSSEQPPLTQLSTPDHVVLTN